jgi:thiol-disulfide isomerase/thioredoxin
MTRAWRVFAIGLILLGAAVLGAYLHERYAGTTPLPPPPANSQPRAARIPEIRPLFALIDSHGQRRSIAEWDGHPLLVNFWATWCEPCREEMPSIDRLRRALEGRPFAVLAVNLAEPEARVRSFLSTLPLGFPVLLDRDGAASRAWRARLLPATFVVGPDARLRYSYVGALDWSAPAVRDAVLGLLQSRT